MEASCARVLSFDRRLTEGASETSDTLEKNKFYRFIEGRFFEAVFRLSSRHDVAGVAVGVPSGSDVWPKLEAAILLVETHSPTDFARLRRLVRRIIVVELLDGEGVWYNDSLTICLKLDFVARSSTHAMDIAATIVHETTHAWLWHFGFGYRIERRGRIEAICYRREAAFARRLGAETLATYYEERASDALDPTRWTPEAFVERRRASLTSIGFPGWLTGILTRRAR
jgi:hypothetical protein